MFCRMRNEDATWRMKNLHVVQVFFDNYTTNFSKIVPEDTEAELGRNIMMKFLQSFTGISVSIWFKIQTEAKMTFN